MPRAGLSTARVVEEAEALADELGSSQITLAEVANRFGVKLPSIYKHIAGAEALQRAMAARAKTELAALLARSTVGRSREDAVIAMCGAYRRWAKEHPGRYELTTRAPDPDDTAGVEASAAVVAVCGDVLSGYQLAGDDAVDAIRALRAVVHGFLDLERGGGFGLPAGTDRSFTRIVTGLTRLLDNWQQPPTTKEKE